MTHEYSFGLRGLSIKTNLDNERKNQGIAKTKGWGWDHTGTRSQWASIGLILLETPFD